MDGVLHAVLPLPRRQLPPGESTTLHFPFRAYDVVGEHDLRVQLLRWTAEGCIPLDVAPWSIPMEVSAVRATDSLRLVEISRKHNPWYYNPLNGILESRDGHPYPVFIARGKGSRVWDVEGHEFIDYTMGWGSTILGHADDRIQTAVRTALDTGAVLPFPHPVEMEVSRQRVITVSGMLLPSTAHDDATLQQTVAAFGTALAVVADADRRNDLHRRVELALL